MPDHPFLCVNAFLSTEMDARAIKSALDLGLIDALLAGGAMSPAEFAAKNRISPVGVGLLIDLLEVNGVVAREGDLAALAPAFQAALPFRDLLEARIAFADLVWPDIHDLFTPLLVDLPQFMARSRVFNLFRYDRCFELTAENLEATRAWTKFTTCLTKYEAAAALEHVNLDSVSSFIDLGGNTGEFALQLCRRNQN